MVAIIRPHLKGKESIATIAQGLAFMRRSSPDELRNRAILPDSSLRRILIDSQEDQVPTGLRGKENMSP